MWRTVYSSITQETNLLHPSSQCYVLMRALGFSVLATFHFLGRFFGFCTKKRQFFGFCNSYGFGFSLFLAYGFRFSAKIQPDFRVWYPTRFSVLPVPFLISGFLNRESVPREFSNGLQTQRSTQGLFSCLTLQLFSA